MDDGSSPELSFLCGAFELLTDDPDRARKAVSFVRHADFADDERRTAFQMLSDVLATVEAPKQHDLTRHELYGRCRETYFQCIQESTRNRAAFSIGIVRYARQVRADAHRRAVHFAAMDLKSLVESRQASSAEILAAAEDVKEAAQAVEQENKPATLSDAVDEYLAHETTPKIETAFAPLDRMCGGGLPVGGLSVFAAPPSVGKSALALQACLGALDVDSSLRVVWCMGEMTMEAMARRATCHWSTRYGQHPVTMANAERRSDLANGSALALKMKVGDRLQLVAPPLSIGKIEDAVVESGARLLVIDYIQLVEMEAADRRAEIDGVVKRIRRLSLERNVAVLAISNIAKGVGADTRIGAIGKESSELDFAADLFLLGDPDPDRDQDGNRMVRWMCKKNRHGPCEDIITKFDGQLQTFSDAQVSPVDDFSTWR
jgi:replicative DNA helicase